MSRRGNIRVLPPSILLLAGSTCRHPEDEQKSLPEVLRFQGLLNNARSVASRLRNSPVVREQAIAVLSRSFMAGSRVVQLHSSGGIRPSVRSGHTRASATP